MTGMREVVKRLERRLQNPPGVVRRIIYVRPGEPEPKDVPPDTLVVQTRTVERGDPCRGQRP
jgi:hypothetical protein